MTRTSPLSYGCAYNPELCWRCQQNGLEKRYLDPTFLPEKLDRSTLHFCHRLVFKDLYGKATFILD